MIENCRDLRSSRTLIIYVVPVQELWFLVTKVTVCTFKIWIDLYPLLSKCQIQVEGQDQIL